MSTPPLYSVSVRKVEDRGSFGPNGHPNIWEGYTLKGHTPSLPTVGEPWQVLRSERNGEKVFGIFTTSPVEEVTLVASEAGRLTFSTANSRYLVQYTLDTAPASVVGSGVA